ERTRRRGAAAPRGPPGGERAPLVGRGRPGGDREEGGVDPGNPRGPAGAAIDPPKREALAGATRRHRRTTLAQPRLRPRPHEAAVHLHIGENLARLGGGEGARERRHAGAGGGEAERGGHASGPARGG